MDAFAITSPNNMLKTQLYLILIFPIVVIILGLYTNEINTMIIVIVIFGLALIYILVSPLYLQRKNCGNYWEKLMANEKRIQEARLSSRLSSTHYWNYLAILCILIAVLKGYPYFYSEGRDTAEKGQWFNVVKLS